MKWKELTKNKLNDFKLKKTFGLHGLYNNISALQGFIINRIEYIEGSCQCMTEGKTSDLTARQTQSFVLTRVLIFVAFFPLELRNKDHSGNCQLLFHLSETDRLFPFSLYYVRVFFNPIGLHSTRYVAPVLLFRGDLSPLI